jgi:8-oxo-dGTP pyrophosphatase MutT (NUDIX family)
MEPACFFISLNARITKNMRQTTLCILKRNSDEILLAMKKRGFGINKWNGVGGKFDSTQDKDIFAAAKRETQEEIGVKLIDAEKVGVLRFRFPYKEDWNQDVHLYLASNWEGEPKESEEMRPQWFNVSEIPYESMWDDDKYWLPHVLSGKKVDADFIFREGEIIDNHNIKIS